MVINAAIAYILSFCIISIPLINGSIVSKFGKSFGHAHGLENVLDDQGKACPIPMRYNVPCPALCVSNVNLCPINVRPANCALGSFYCQDGICRKGSNQQAACKSVQSVCFCSNGFDPSIKLTKETILYPCNTTKVNVPNYAQNDIVGDGPLYSKCSSAVNIAVNPQTDAGAAFLLQCAPKVVPQLSYKEPAFLAIYALILAEFTLLGLYHIYRTRLNVGSVIQAYTY